MTFTYTLDIPGYLKIYLRKKQLPLQVIDSASATVAESYGLCAPSSPVHPAKQHNLSQTHTHGHRYKAPGPPVWSAVERVATCQSADLGCLKRDISSGTTAARPSPYIRPPLATIAGWLRGFVPSQQESTIEPWSL